jgi:hypothetical protein
MAKKKPRYSKSRLDLEELTLKDIFSVLSVYGVEHLPFVTNYATVKSKEITHGLCDSERKKIYSDTDQSIEDIPKILIHELLHAKHDLKGDLTKMSRKKMEKYIHQEMEFNYYKIYSQKRPLKN